MIQQGDVLFIPIPYNTVPKQTKPVDPKNGRLVIAEGEATGHAHAILAANAGKEQSRLLITDDDKQMFLVNNASVDVFHEEHDIVTIPPGTWAIKGVQEYDYDKEQARRIQD